MELSNFRDEKWENEVKSNTWGHLFPKDGYYEGSITVAQGVYGNVVILKEDIDIEGSPWWFQEINQFLDTVEMESGCIYKIDISVFVDESNDDEQIIINQLRKRVIVL